MIPNRPPRLLVVDDKPVTRARLEAYFSKEGYMVSTAQDGDTMRRMLASGGIDVVLLDVGLPGVDGLELARDLRAKDDHIGIIFVTSRCDDIDKIVGLESGADDYVTKPFNSRELLARVKIVLRAQRCRPVAQTRNVLSFKGWTLDMTRRCLVNPKGNGEQLTRGEFELLATLVRHPGVALSRERLTHTVCRRPWHPNDRTIDVLISRLREKLEDDPKAPQFIVTVRGEGYLFAVDVTPV